MTVTANVLVLNAAYLPISIIKWEEAITLWCKEKVEILESYDDVYLRSWESAMNCPAVIRLQHSFSKQVSDVKFYESFTRKNVYDRDGGMCQYCGKDISLNQMTFDHVIPKANGGLTNWTNIVCSCDKCNTKKGCKTLNEAGMKLLKKPYAPKIADDYIGGIMSKMKQSVKNLNNEKWRSYIYWNIPMDEEKEV